MNAVIIFTILCVLLVAGKVLRVKIPALQRMYLPSSVIGGLIGLVILNTLPSCGIDVSKDLVKSAQSLPGFLINIIFATLFLGGGIPKVKSIAWWVLPQLTLAQITVWGQYVVGVGLCGFLLAPKFGVSQAFGNLLELGFEGGHGTVGGMQEAFVAHNWVEGIALGYTVATVGMIFGIVVGMLLVNLANARGWVKEVRPFSMRTRVERSGIHARDYRPDAGKQTVKSDSIDSLAWHIAIVGLTVLVGFGILKVLQVFEVWVNPNGVTRLFKGFPMFPLCMLGGVILEVGSRLLRINLLVDKGQMTRISGAALDFLAVSAVSTIELSVVAANWIPLTLMCVLGLIWTVFAVLYFSPRLFRDAWFERGIAEFGQATGVTATGLLLLRTVDPENKTIAAASFAGKQLFHEPAMNLWVATAFALVFTVGWVPVLVISTVMLIIWLGIAWSLRGRARADFHG